VTVSLDSSGMDAGTYRALLCLTNDDPDQGLVRVPVTMTVTDQVCTQTITGAHHGPLSVRTGTLCVAPGALVNGPVSIQSSAGLFAIESTVRGPISAARADGVTLNGVSLSGPLSVSGTTGTLRLEDNRVNGPVSLVGNHTGDHPIVVSGNSITGPLSCSGNNPPPVNNGHPNNVRGPTAGQCSGL
jgi:hypothetical protein